MTEITESVGSAAAKSGSDEYRATRAVSRTASFIGWLIGVAGGIGVVGGISTATQGGMSDKMTGVVITGLSILTVVSGLLLVVFGQVVRASVDTADNTRQLVELLRSRGIE